MVKYYPQELSIAKAIREFPEIEWVNEEEEVRLQDIKDRKARGKGTPKKAKSKGMFSLALKISNTKSLVTEESRRTNRKRKVAKKEKTT
jgi:hypothetical protein